MLGSSFLDVFVINPSRIEPATADDVADLESRLGCRMPSGYADFVERLGEGALGHFTYFLPAIGGRLSLYQFEAKT